MLINNQLKLIHPNAWFSEIERVGSLLDTVYAHTFGEIWLFDNDLAVLESRKRPAQQRSAFQMFYNDLIDSSLATRVRCIKILLRRELYDRFCDSIQSRQLVHNLCSLRACRLKTFYVGCLDDVNPPPPPELGGHSPWIFYLGENNLASKSGIVIVRPRTYPFSDGDGENADIAVGWRTSDPELGAIHFRLQRDWFQNVFETNYMEHFKSLNPLVNNEGKVVNYEFCDPRDEHDIDNLWENLQSKSLPPVIAPVDCAIITALPEEQEAALKVFNLNWIGDGVYATGRVKSEQNDVTLVATRCPKTGSVHSAVQTARTIDLWKPKCVFLLGRCAGVRDENLFKGASQKNEDDMQEGDVIVSTFIMAYEYRAVKKDESGEFVEEVDAREIPVSDHLSSRLAVSVIQSKWSHKDNDQMPEEKNSRNPKAFLGGVASGCKLLRSGERWFKELKSEVGKRKIIAGEMEGEGVGEAVNTASRRPHFLLIKGISDFGNPAKNDKNNNLASVRAARFLQDLIEQPNFVEFLRSQQNSEG